MDNYQTKLNIMITTEQDFLKMDRVQCIDNEIYELKLIRNLKVANYSFQHTKKSIYDWVNNTTDGLWISQYCKHLTYVIVPDNIPGIKFFIVVGVYAYIKPHDFTFYSLKFSS